MNFSQTLLVGITTASLTGILTLFVQYIVASLQRHNEKDKALDQEKRAAYKQLLKLVYDTLGAIVSGEELSKDLDNDIFKIERDLTIYASDDVFRLFVELQKTLNKKQNAIKPLAKLVLAIRRDLGHKNTKISLKEILSPVVRDFDKILEKP
jgi:undecaprenyl pyrophosphate phosphatase UppP